MTITDIKVRRLMNDGRLKAIISMTLDDIIAIHDIKVVQGDGKLFVAMPSRKDESGSFRDVVHPISAEGRKQIEDMIIDAYHRAVLDAEIDEEACNKF